MTADSHRDNKKIGFLFRPIHQTFGVRETLGIEVGVFFVATLGEDALRLFCGLALLLPATPDARLADLLMNRLGEIATVDGSVSVACLLTRPGVAAQCASVSRTMRTRWSSAAHRARSSALIDSHARCAACAHCATSTTF